MFVAKPAAAETTKHTWYDQIAHIQRPNGHTVRACVGAAGFEAGYVYMVVFFNDGGKRKRKKVSPLMLAAAQLSWLNRDLISDDEDLDVVVVSQGPGNTWPIPPLRHPLPLLELELSSIPLQWHISWQWHKAQVHLLQLITLTPSTN